MNVKVRKGKNQYLGNHVASKVTPNDLFNPFITCAPHSGAQVKHQIGRNIITL